MKTDNTTITDKDDFSVKIIDEAKFSKLTDNEKVVFEYLRNGMLEIFPLTDNKYDDETIRYAENHAFIALKGFNKFYEKIIEPKFLLVEESLNQKITTLTASLATPSVTPTV